jgi:hypothetical protein
VALAGRGSHPLDDYSAFPEFFFSFPANQHFLVAPGPALGTAAQRASRGSPRSGYPRRVSSAPPTSPWTPPCTTEEPVPDDRKKQDRLATTIAGAFLLLTALIRVALSGGYDPQMVLGSALATVLGLLLWGGYRRGVRWLVLSWPFVPFLLSALVVAGGARRGRGLAVARDMWRPWEAKVLAAQSLWFATVMMLLLLGSPSKARFRTAVGLGVVYLASCVALSWPWSK